MALDADSFDLLLSTVQRFVRERLVPAENHRHRLVEPQREAAVHAFQHPIQIERHHARRRVGPRERDRHVVPRAKACVARAKIDVGRIRANEVL